MCIWYIYRFRFFYSWDIDKQARNTFLTSLSLKKTNVQCVCILGTITFRIQLSEPFEYKEKNPFTLRWKSTLSLSKYIPFININCSNMSVINTNNQYPFLSIIQKWSLFYKCQQRMYNINIYIFTFSSKQTLFVERS